VLRIRGLSRTQNTDFCPSGIRISGPLDPKTATKERGEKNLLIYKYHKIVNYFLFELMKIEIWANFTKNYRAFYQKIVMMLSKIYVLGSGIRKKPIPDSGSGVKKAPDPQYCLKI
jgi:hypothetical protein